MTPSETWVTERWRITLISRDRTWSEYVKGTYDEAQRYAQALCYEPSTRYSIAPAS